MLCQICMDINFVYPDVSVTSASGATALLSATPQQKLAGMPVTFKDVSCNDYISFLIGRKKRN